MFLNKRLKGDQLKESEYYDRHAVYFFHLLLSLSWIGCTSSYRPKKSTNPEKVVEVILILIDFQLPKQGNLMELLSTVLVQSWKWPCIITYYLPTLSYIEGKKHCDNVRGSNGVNCQLSARHPKQASVGKSQTVLFCCIRIRFCWTCNKLVAAE